MTTSDKVSLITIGLFIIYFPKEAGTFFLVAALSILGVALLAGYCYLFKQGWNVLWNKN